MEEKNRFLKLDNKIAIKLKIVPLSPLSIKFSKNEKENDGETQKTFSAILTTEKGNIDIDDKGVIKKEERKGEIYIPGSSIRGLFRDRFLIISKESEDYVNELFGFVKNDKAKKSRVFIYDAFLSDVEKRKAFYEGDYKKAIENVTSSRSITPVDHFSSKAKVPLQYEYTMETFTTELVLNNCYLRDLQAIYLLIRDSMNKELRIGNSKTRGFGLVEFAIENLSYEQFKSDRDELELFEEYFSVNDKKSKKIGDKYISKILELKEEFKTIDIENPNKFIESLFEMGVN